MNNEHNNDDLSPAPVHSKPSDEQYVGLELAQAGIHVTQPTVAFPGPTVGASVANLAAIFPQQVPRVNDSMPESEEKSVDSDEEPRTRKRPSPGNESESVPMPPPAKKSAATSAEHKRNREKQRRSELNETLDDLSELVFQIDPSLRSGRAEVVGDEDQRMMSAGRKNTITNRTELIQCTVRLLKRIHAENQRKDQVIADLGQAKHKRNKGQVSQGGAQVVNNGTGLNIPSTANTPAVAIGATAPARMDPSAALLGAQTAYPPMMATLAPGHMHFGNGGAALPGLMFQGPFQGLLGGGGSVSGFQGAQNHLLFGTAMRQQQQQQGHGSPYAPGANSLPTPTTIEVRPYQTMKAHPPQIHRPTPDLTQSGTAHDGDNESDGESEV